MDRRILYIAILFYALVAFFSVGFNHHDEHFQILEFAYYKLGLVSAQDLAWEFEAQIRPAFMPGLVMVFHQLGISDPFILATWLRLLSAALCLTSICFLFKAFKFGFSDDQKPQWLALLLLFLWFIPYIGVRYSADGWAGSLFMLGFGISHLYGPHQMKRQIFWAGAFMGLAFLAKYQAGFLILGFYLWWLWRKVPFVWLLYSGLLMLAVIGLGLGLDRWFYGEWVFTPWNYVYENMIAGKIDQYGGPPKPFWFYLPEVIVRAVPPISLWMVAAVGIYVYRFPKAFITGPFVIYFLAHCFIGHKEIRYLFPLALFIPLMMVTVWEALEEKPGWFKPFWQHKLTRFFVKLSIGLNLVLLLVVLIHPPKPEVNLYQKIYRQYPDPTTLYFQGRDPYVQLLEIHFYQRPTLNQVEIQDLSEIPATSSQARLFATQDPKAIEQWPGESTLIYQSFPNWLTHFNINDWMSRTQRWFVYELKGGNS